MLKYRDRKRIIAKSVLRNQLKSKHKLSSDWLAALSSFAAAIAALLSTWAAFRLEQVTIDIGRAQEAAQYESNLLSKELDDVSDYFSGSDTTQAALEDVSDNYDELRTQKVKPSTINAVVGDFGTARKGLEAMIAAKEKLSLVLGAQAFNQLGYQTVALNQLYQTYAEGTKIEAGHVVAVLGSEELTALERKRHELYRDMFQYKACSQRLLRQKRTIQDGDLNLCVEAMRKEYDYRLQSLQGPD